MEKTTPIKPGKIIFHGVKPEAHEMATILYFAKLGKNIELIIPSSTPHAKNADFFMDNLAWESKSPQHGERRTIERIFYKASTQSCNVIMDLRRLKKNNPQTIHTLQKCFKNTRHIHNLLIITKDGSLESYKK